jgi:hypothetical protein
MPVAIPSTGFVDTLRFGSFLVEARCTVYSTGVATTFQVPLSVATVTVTRNSAQRRQCTVTAQIVPDVPPPAILPTSPSSLLAPFGNEIFIETGIATSDGTVKQWMPLGLFAISTVAVNDTTIDLAVTIDGYDRSWVIAQRKFKEPYNVPAVTGNFIAEIKHLVNQVWGSTPPLTYNIVPTTAKVPKASYNQGATPWTAALQMANAVGYELFFNATGIVTGYPIPTPAKQPITWNFTDTPDSVYGAGGTGGSTSLFGSPYSTPVAVAMQFTRDQIYNHVIVTGTGSQNATGATTGSTAPVVGEAKDTNPASSTYVTGPVGDIPQFVSTNLMLTAAQAEAAAANYLQVALSDAWQITLTCPPNPMFDIDDVVTVTRPRIGIKNLKMVIDSIEHTLSYGTLMKITGRIVP